MHAKAMSPHEVDHLLSSADLPLARSAYAETVEDVTDAFGRVGAEVVVLKAAGLVHKTDVGGVHLGLRSAADAVQAARVMHDGIGDGALPFLLQEQVSGLEMLVGIRRTPDLGAVIVVGLGGVETEVHDDIAQRLVPVDAAEAERMLQQLRTWPLLDGFRGRERRDVSALVQIIERVAALADRDHRIIELDLNPVVIGLDGSGCTVVDARVVTGADPTARERASVNLDRMLNPDHVAVVGVSDNEHKVGARLFRYFLDHDFPGRLDPVHPAGGEVRGQRRYTTLESVDGSPDLVCVAVPAKGVLEVARQAVKAKVGGMIVHSSDFAEVGESGRAVQAELVEILGEGNIPLLGPNSMGVVSPGRNLTASISGGLEMAELRAGPIALLTSSGALGSCLATRLMDAGFGLSQWIHVGNEAQLVVADCLEWLVDDPDTGAVALLLEDVKDGPRFVAAGRALAAAGKPMFAYNMVRSERGREAALSHTGAMVGSYAVREEVIRAAGMVSVPSLRVLEDALVLSASSGVPRGDRLMVVAFSGGACTIIADEADQLGLRLPELSTATRDRVREHVPAFAAIRNPLDVSYQMITEPENLRRTIVALLSAGEFDSALVQFTTNADPYAEQTAEAVIAARGEVDVPVYVSRYGGPQLAPRALRRYEAAGVPVLDAPDRAAQAVAAVVRAHHALHGR